MVALLVFGVYAAGSSATFTVKSTVSFSVQDVHIKVAAGSGVEPNSSTTYYYSRPSGDQLNVSELTSLPNGEFSDETQGGNVLNYYLYVENLHGQDINVAFAYTWKNSSKYNSSSSSATDGAVSVEAKLLSIKDGSTTQTAYNPTFSTPTTSDGVRTDSASAFTNNHTFLKGETVIFVVTITLKSDAMVYKLSNSSLELSAKASLDTIESME